jgi:hypothetical protein
LAQAGSPSACLKARLSGLWDIHWRRTPRHASNRELRSKCIVGGPAEPLLHCTAGSARLNGLSRLGRLRWLGRVHRHCGASPRSRGRGAEGATEVRLRQARALRPPCSAFLLCLNCGQQASEHQQGQLHRERGADRRPEGMNQVCRGVRRRCPTPRRRAERYEREIPKDGNPPNASVRCVCLPGSPRQARGTGRLQVLALLSIWRLTLDELEMESVNRAKDAFEPELKRGTCRER